MRIFMNCGLLFPAFVGNLFSIQHFQEKANRNRVLALASGRKSCKSKGEK